MRRSLAPVLTLASALTLATVFTMAAGSALAQGSKADYERANVLRERFRDLIQSGHFEDRQSFQLRPGITVNDPDKWARALLRSLDKNDARCRTGAAQRDLDDFLAKPDGEKSK